MRVRDDKQRFSVAALLLCLLAAFAVSPPDYFRTSNSTRSRASRTLRLDDHDQDHSLDVASLSGDLAGVPLHDQPFGLAVLPARVEFAHPGGPLGVIPIEVESRFSNPSCPIRSGRAPPAV